jgi:Tfp pilus assembly protein PilF
MKFKYIFVVTIITFNITYAFRPEVKQTGVIEYSKKKEYKSLINKANKYALNNQIEKSLETAKKAFDIDGTKKDALLIMARIYNYKKDFVNLRKTAEKILKISPDNYLGNIYLFNSYFTNDKKKAREIITAMAKKYPDDENIKKKLKLL